MNQTEMDLLPKLEELPRLNRAVSDFSDLHRLPSAIRELLLLSCEEWFVNIVHHGYPPGGDREAEQGSVRFCLSLDESQWVTLRFVDDAIPFDPVAYPKPVLDAPLEERTIGGLGIYFIKRKMDGMSYSRCGGRNVLVLRKQFQLEEEETV